MKYITSRDNINIEENFKIEAGPGAGKTEFLVNHIKNILKDSKRIKCSRKIACITYTNVAVETILKRLKSNIADKVEVSTIHSFLYRNIVKPYCSFVPTKFNLCCQKIKGHEDFNINNYHINSWLKNNIKFDKLTPPNSKNQLLKIQKNKKALKNWLLSIKCTLKEETVSFKCENKKAVDYENHFSIKKSNLNILSNELINLKKIFWADGKLAHEDVLFFSIILINEYPFILNIIRAKFPYLIIDEYQDTNPIQSFILEKIRNQETIVGVIGDKAQSIYKFQGASPLLFEKFKSTHNYKIKDNHRSSNQIIAFLNNIRKDIQQLPCRNIDDSKVCIFIGNKNIVYNEVCNSSHQKFISLSRTNIISNAMKKDIQQNDLDNKLNEKFKVIDNNSTRRNFILSFIKTIELAINNKYKEALKEIEKTLREKNDPKKMALSFLVKMLNLYPTYIDGTLMEFYTLVSEILDFKLSKFKAGKIKDFYDNTLYKNIAICFNIPEDTSDHITIHKAKGAEYDNVMLIGNKETLKFLINPDLKNNEEHRIVYVALSRARNKLIINFEKLETASENSLKEKYPYIDFKKI